METEAGTGVCVWVTVSVDDWFRNLGREGKEREIAGGEISSGLFFNIWWWKAKEIIVW